MAAFAHAGHGGQCETAGVDLVVVAGLAARGDEGLRGVGCIARGDGERKDQGQFSGEAHVWPLSYLDR